MSTASTSLKSSESRIRDLDMAREMMTFTRINILSQSGTSMRTPSASLSIFENGQVPQKTDPKRLNRQYEFSAFNVLSRPMKLKGGRWIASSSSVFHGNIYGGVSTMRVIKIISAAFIAAATIASAAIAAPRVVNVSTAEELIAAIASDTTIKLAPGTYNLTDALAGSVDRARGTRISEEHDGPQLCVDGVRGLTIEGGANAANYHIVVTPKYADVIQFTDCEKIALKGLTMGHVERGGCVGSVIDLAACDGVEIFNCDLYGCGVIGIEASDTDSIKVTRSVIRDCSESLVFMSNVKGATFTDVELRNAPDAWVSAVNMQGRLRGVKFERVLLSGFENSRAFSGFEVSLRDFAIHDSTLRLRGSDGSKLCDTPIECGSHDDPNGVLGIGFDGEYVNVR